jgi:hypothetical protein
MFRKETYRACPASLCGRRARAGVESKDSAIDDCGGGSKATLSTVCVTKEGSKIVDMGGSETSVGHNRPWAVKQGERKRNLELGEGPQDELQFADVAVHA